jgi:hypothetical protein
MLFFQYVFPLTTMENSKTTVEEFLFIPRTNHFCSNIGARDPVPFNEVIRNCLPLHMSLLSFENSRADWFQAIRAFDIPQPRLPPYISDKRQKTDLIKIVTSSRIPRKNWTKSQFTVMYDVDDQKPLATVPMFCFLSSLPLSPPATTPVFGSYLSSLYS